MKTSSKLWISVAAASVGLALVSAPTLANQKHGHGANTPTGAATPHGGQGGMMGGGMMQMMERMHGMMNSGGMGAGMMGSGMMGGGMQQAFDTDKDGAVSPEELRNGLLVELKAQDADGDNALSIEEFEVLHSARIRNQMVDKFQKLDANGDGLVTEAEMAAPADKMEMRLKRQNANAPMKKAQGPAKQNSTTNNN
jgi:Ca2+-binding EF-hand superfamily protein